jgi:Mg2+ and Co2+ transporter CorA
VIELADYSSVRNSSERMTNHEFINYLSNPQASKREPWVKVRWINIGGISWDVIRALALKYDLHPLALEELLQHPNRLRSKADYYPQHLFLRVLSHTLAKDKEVVESYIDNLPRSESPEPMDEKVDYSNKNSDEGYASTTGLRPRLRGNGKVHQRGTNPSPGVDIESIDVSRDPTSARFGTFAPTVGVKMDATTLRLIQELKDGDKVNVALHPVFIFLFRDGTVISIHPKPNLEFTRPIRERLRLRSTVLRSTADPSLLVHSLLDLIVDSVMELVDEYQGKIVKLEHDILLRPKMKTVRFLHILSGDLTLHKRTLEPIKTVIYGLRRYDRDRVAAKYDAKDLPEGWKPEGYMSHKASIYLADVHDHMEYILASLDMFAGISENLINYSFNMASYDMNQVMRRLTLVTIICLPLTLFTGYFGMNFESMWSVKEHTDLLFWEIAIPVMAILIPLFTWSDLVKMYHYGQKKVWAKRLDQRLKGA